MLKSPSAEIARWSTASRRAYLCPARTIDKSAAAIARGEGDAAALRLAHHDAKAHQRLSPKGPEARAVFAALENARCEAIGARALKGVGDNLGAALEKAIADKGYDRLNAHDARPSRRCRRPSCA